MGAKKTARGATARAAKAGVTKKKARTAAGATSRATKKTRAAHAGATAATSRAAKKTGAARKGAAKATGGASRATARTANPTATSKGAALAKAPVVWKLKTSAQAVGIHVESDRAWVGNDAGEIFVVDHDGAPIQHFKLPGAVRCLIADEAWRYAGCNDGNVYDLTGRVPRALYRIGEDVELDWIDVYRGNLLVSDDDGGCTVLGADEELRWKKKDGKYRHGWTVRADGAGVYHGGDAGVRAFDWEGKPRWKHDTNEVHFGWLDGERLVVITADPAVAVLGTDGALRWQRECHVAHGSFRPNGAESCAAAPDGRVFGGSGGWLFCFDADGAPLWQAPTGCGAACSMHYFEERLYIVTSDGAFTCIDVSPAAIDAARAGRLPKAKVRKADALHGDDAAAALERTTDVGSGVVVECVKEGGKLRVRVVSEGYQASWFVQFPRDLREEGARYVVDAVREATQGGFYRALGDIKRLDR